LWTRWYIPRRRYDDIPNADGAQAGLRPLGPVLVGNFDGCESEIGKFDLQRRGGTVPLACGHEEDAPVIGRALVNGGDLVIDERRLEQL
jgi:hypothetical protein